MNVSTDDLKKRLGLLKEWFSQKYIEYDDDCRRGSLGNFGCSYQAAIEAARDKVEELFGDLKGEQNK
jgi:hypothetical protein